MFQAVKVTQQVRPAALVDYTAIVLGEPVVTHLPGGPPAVTCPVHVRHQGRHTLRVHRVASIDAVLTCKPGDMIEIWGFRGNHAREILVPKSSGRIHRIYSP